MAKYNADDFLRDVRESERGAVLIKLGRKKVTSAQLLALLATPQTIVSALPTGSTIAQVPLYTFLYKEAGTAYTIGTNAGLILRYVGGANAQFVETTGFLDQTTAQRRLVSVWQSAESTGKQELVPTQAVGLELTVLTANVTVGTAALWVEVYGFRTPSTLTFA